MNITGQIDTPAGVLKHPANDSSSKFQWTFSKSARFPQPKTYTSTISYDLPSTASRRKSGMGFGNRSTIFDGLKDKPDPTRYTISSTFKDKRSGRGHSFGSSRDNIKFANYLKQSEDTPGPYDINDKQTKSTRAYSLRPRTAYPKNYFLYCNEEQQRVKDLPGPANYETVDMMGSGKDFYNSKFKTQKQKSFNGGSRFSREKTTPGPSDYSNRTIEPDGRCLLSTMKSYGRRQILNQKRQLKLVRNKDIPGPGEYQKPSDFGHYDRPGSLTRPRTARN